MAAHSIDVDAGTETPPEWLAGGHDHVRVLDHHPELVADLEPRTAEMLRRRLTAPKLVVEPGPWTPPAPAEGAPLPAVLVVVSGFLMRSVHVGARHSPEIVGPGDVVFSWLGTADDASVPLDASWCALTRATVAVLDERFTEAMRRWPSIMSRLLACAVEYSRGLAFTLSIVHSRRTETRLLLLLWHLADRWGRVTPEGVHVPLPLTHQMLADLMCVRRPTLSTAAARLADAGRLGRRADGSWMLHGDPPAIDEGEVDDEAA